MSDEHQISLFQYKSNFVRDYIIIEEEEQSIGLNILSKE
jgi:hypothetical protein